MDIRLDGTDHRWSDRERVRRRLSLRHSPPSNGHSALLPPPGVTYPPASIFDPDVAGHPHDGHSTVQRLATRAADCRITNFAGCGRLAAMRQGPLPSGIRHITSPDHSGADFLTIGCGASNVKDAFMAHTRHTGPQ